MQGVSEPALDLLKIEAIKAKSRTLQAEKEYDRRKENRL